MCYSAMVWADYRDYVRHFKANIRIKEFYRTFVRRSGGAKMLIPRAVEAAFADGRSEDERAIWDLIQAFRKQEASRFEEELFSQKTRLVEAERKLAVKTTKAAQESQRIATNKIEWAKAKLFELRREEPVEEDARIFPRSYVPVLVMEDGELVVKPMRFGCRPSRAPAFYDDKFPGTFNARRDNLEKFWRDEFGKTHGIAVISSFFENVPLHKAEARELRPGEEEQNAKLQFKPQPQQDMLVACVWSHWVDQKGVEDDLDSFAFITDEPPEEVAAAGHDRCVIPIKRENVLSWLSPNAKDLKTQYAILDDRARPYYQALRLAA